MGLIVLGVMIVFIWLQINLLNAVPLFGVKPNVGIVLVVALSIFCGQGIGISVGLVQGILTDILFGKAIGIYTFLFFLVGLFGGKMSKGFSKENKGTLMMITAGATIVFEVISYLLFCVIYEYDFALIPSLKTILLEGIYNIFLSRIFFQFFSNLSEAINRGKKSYYLL